MKHRLLLMLLVLALGAAPLRAQVERITPGETVVGELAAQAAQADYEFEAAAGEIFSASAVGSPEPIRALIVSGPDGATLIDVRDYFDPQMDTGYVQLPASGIYRVTILGGQPTGYELRLRRREPPLLRLDGDNGEAGRDYFYENLQAMPFVFEAQGGDTVMLSAGTDTFDPLLTLYGPDGGEIARDDDSGGDLMPRLGPLTLPQTGRYRLDVSAYDAGGSGTVWANVWLPAPPQPSDITYDQTVRAPLSVDAPGVVYHFEAQDGDVVALHVDDPGAASRVSLREVYNGLFATTYLRRDSRPRFYHPDRITLARGHYELAVEALDATDLPPGTVVTVRVDLLRQRSLDFTDQSFEGRPSPALRVFMNDKDPVQTFSIFDDGSNGITLTVLATRYWGGTLPPFRVVLAREERVVASYTMEAVQGIYESEITAHLGPAAGLIEVRLELLGAGPVWFSLARELSYGIG